MDQATILQSMNELAVRQLDAFRLHLQTRALKVFGSYRAAADAAGVPKTNLYRALTSPADSFGTPIQPLVLLADALSREAGDPDFGEVWREVTRKVK